MPLRKKKKRRDFQDAGGSDDLSASFPMTGGHGDPDIVNINIRDDNNQPMPPPPEKPPSVNIFNRKQHTESISYDADGSSGGSASSVPFYMDRGEMLAHDNTLDDIINVDKIRRDHNGSDQAELGFDEIHLSSDSGGSSKRRKKRRKRKHRRGESRRDSPTPQLPPDFFGGGTEDDEEHDNELLRQFSAFGVPAPQMQVDPLQSKLEADVRKGQLLARLDQLKAKGVKSDKKLNWQSNEREIRVEIARMETIAYRSSRIETGRGMFMLPIGGIEQGANFVDKKEYLGDFKLCLDGVSKHVLSHIDKFDDALERGVYEMMGPPGERDWKSEIMWLLVPLMISYSIGNRKNSEHEAKVREEEREKLKREILDELGQQVPPQPQQQQPARAFRPTQFTTQTSTRDGTTPERPRMKPPVVPVQSTNPFFNPPPKVPTQHPFGDYEIAAEETARMAQEILRAGELAEEQKNGQQLPHMTILNIGKQPQQTPEPNPRVEELSKSIEMVI